MKNLPYKEHRPSGLSWVGDIPKHWQVKPLFTCFYSPVHKNSDGRQSNVLSLSYGRIIRRNVETNSGLLPESFNTYQIVQPNDIIMRLTDLQNDKKSLRTGLVRETGIITSAYLRLTPTTSLNPEYSHYLLHSYDKSAVYYGMGGGLRQSMKFEDMRRLGVVLPPPAEQKTIAAFLDYETTKIDALIAKQERLIELLKEKRQAVISQAVTKGLNPNAPMKDSGVEWLGEVPLNWTMTRLRYLGNLNPAIDNALKRNLSQQVSFLPMAAVGEQGELDLTETRQAERVAGGYTFMANEDIAFAKVTPCFENGKGAVLRNLKNGYAFGTTELTVFRANHQLIPDYCDLIFRCDGFRRNGVAHMTGAGGLKRVTDDYVRDFAIALPDAEGQKSIVAEVKAQLDTLETLNQKSKHAVDLLKERRSALISAAVTGKIDVRGWRTPEG